MYNQKPQREDMVTKIPEEYGNIRLLKCCYARHVDVHEEGECKVEVRVDLERSCSTAHQSCHHPEMCFRMKARLRHG